MLRTLLSPLSARFTTSPLIPSQEPTSARTPNGDLAPEDFARDVLVEVMRASVERLKVAEGLNARKEVLVEIHRIILEDPCTKDVFREVDGFLVLMSVLSTIQPTHSWAVAESRDQIVTEVLDAVRLVFAIISEAMQDHRQNTDFFERSVGYESLYQALVPLVSDAKTVDQTFGFLVSLALQNTSLSGIFAIPPDADYALVDKHLHDLEPTLTFIRHPGAVRVLFNALQLMPSANASIRRYSVYKFLESLSLQGHRNHAVLSTLGLVGSLFTTLCPPPDGGESPGPSSTSTPLPKQERQVILRLLKRLLELGATTDDARAMFQRVVKSDDTLDADVLEVLRAGLKTRWPDHFSLQGSSAAVVRNTSVKGFPPAGFTFMIWLWIDRFPAPQMPHAIFSIRSGDQVVFSLRLRADGSLECQSVGSKDVAVFNASSLPKARWTHLALVHHPHRNANPTVRLFLDGLLVDSVNWPYVKNDASKEGTYVVGDVNGGVNMSWCMTSCYLIGSPLTDDVPRIVHHLGPRYNGHFQSAELVKLLTYEASTSISIFLAGAGSQKGSAQTDLMGHIKHGLDIKEESILFALIPSGEASAFSGEKARTTLDGVLGDNEANPDRPALEGDIFEARCTTLDLSMWKIGGASVPLRLVQLANTPHEVSRTLGILSGGLRNSWQNSDDMERLRGYDILADILRSKSQLINMTGFETLFEFLGLNFRSPDQSTVVNTVAYRAIALDFTLWARTRTEIQHVYFEHFTTLLQTSKHKRFNAKQRLGKMGIVRKLLFALQTDWFQLDSVPWVIEALKVVAQAHFVTDDTIKPIMSYLAAYLHDDGPGNASPRSVVSRMDYRHSQLKAEHVLQMIVSILQSPPLFTKFSSALPLTRICLLLLGDRPTPVIATQVLRLVEMGLKVSTSFNRKFELVSGWNTLRTVLPHGWSPSTQAAAFDILLGRANEKEGEQQNVVVCPNILSAIFASLQSELDAIASHALQSDYSSDTTEPGPTVERLLEEIIEVHSSSHTFRQVFKSQSTTQHVIDAYKSFVSALSSAAELDQRTVRILEKFTHLGLSIALDTSVNTAQKQEIMDVLQSAETLLNPRAAQESSINPAVVLDKKWRRRRIASTRLSVQLGERAVQRSIARIHEWRKTVIITEKKRVRKMVLDLREHRRQVAGLTEWITSLTTERGIWAKPSAGAKWRLDETEGPYRVRKKLEPEHENVITFKIDAQARQGGIQEPEQDAQSVMHSLLDVPPWAESYEFSSTDSEENQLDEEIVEDKHRRVRHELEPGDVIEAASTVARIAGVDSSPGLLIFGRTHLYMLDGLVESDDGEVIDAHDAPKRLFFVPGSIVELDGPQRAQRWSYDQVASYSDKTFLFRDVGIEIYFKDSRSLLVVFLDKAQRQATNDRLSSIVAGHYPGGESLTPGLLRSPMMGRLNARVSGRISSRAFMVFKPDELSTAQRKWQAREISNFTYLSILNQISGRTPSDATQYPIFPWVISDYESETLNLGVTKTFRDLTRPMGALTPARREAAESRYVNLQSVGEKPFHYGTHFSSSMIVCHFLIRLEPFTHMFKTLQGGDWDLPDRLFSDVQRAYHSASQDVRGDVRELIPEFYSCPEFLENSRNWDFGVQQGTGERINDVKLPRWAKQDPLLFIELNRQALESDYVSRNLPAWIDLIWGCKQRDANTLNTFHPLSYEGSIDLDSITDELEREATVGIIHNFGQTPRKLFNAPHPDRMMHGTATLPIGTIYGIAEDYHLLSQGSKVVQNLGYGNAVRQLTVDLIGERILPSPAGHLMLPSRPHEAVQWNARCGELRVLVDRKVVQVIESACCSTAAFADADTLVTGSTDYTVRMWRLSRGGSGSGHTLTPVTPRASDGQLNLSLTHIMRAHTAPVVSVTASRAWSLVVSGSQDGSAVLWDLNRGVYVRSIWHEHERDCPVHLVAINESAGYIATCSREKLCLHTVNGRPIATLDLSDLAPSPFYPPITSLAFHEREYSQRGILATGAPDGTITLRTWNTDNTPPGEKARWEFVTLKTLKVKTAEGERQPRGSTCVTALRFVGEMLYHGEDSGKVFCWELPD